MKLVIIADDFTGSNDTGVQFAKKGLTTVVTTNIDEIPESLTKNDIIVFDTESRFDNKDAAYKKVKTIASKVKSKGVKRLYKKIDSTFRGNIGAELAGAMDGFDCDFMILIPALPSNHRITKNGDVLVHGQKLHETEVAKDPKTPVTDSFIPNIIGKQSNIKTKIITKTDIAYEKKYILDAIKSAKKAKEKIIIFDAESNDDLILLASCLPHIKDPYILAGTAGLAEFLPDIYDLAKKRPMLAVLGSVSQVTRQQVRHAQNAEKIHIIHVNIERLFDEEYQNTIIRQAIETINMGKNTAIYTAENTEALKVAKRLAVASNISDAQMSDNIVQVLAQITEHILYKIHHKIGSLFVTGGDTLIKISNQLNADGMIVKDEILPAIPACHFIHDQYANINVITKAGAFGDEDALEKIIDLHGAQHQ